MNEDNINDIFRNFDPVLSPDFQFMGKLKRNIEAVAIIKERQVRYRRRSKRAVLIAALSGFVSGMVFAIFIPLIEVWISALILSVLQIGEGALADSSLIVSWLMVAAVSVLVSLGVYERFIPSDSAISPVPEI